jgi:hypothetical protein
MTVIIKSHSTKLVISNWEETFLFTYYVHTYIPTHRHGNISMSQIQQDVEQVINKQIYTILQCKIPKTFYKTVL